MTELQMSSVDAIRLRLEKQLSRYRASLRVGALEAVDGERILADVLDKNDTVVLSVEVDRHSGEILRCL